MDALGNRKEIINAYVHSTTCLTYKRFQLNAMSSDLKLHITLPQIPVVSDVPVGENLQDHVMADPIVHYSPFGGLSLTAAKAENFMSSWSYSLFGTGKGVRIPEVLRDLMTFCLLRSMECSKPNQITFLK